MIEHPRMINIKNLSREDKRLSILYFPMLATFVLKYKNNVLKNKLIVMTIIKGSNE